MMKKLRLFPLIIVFIASFTFIGCSDNDDEFATPAIPGGSGNVTLNDAANEFTWRAMNLWYFWQGSVADLSDSRFTNFDDFYTYLNGFADPDDLFKNGLLFTDDRFSFITPDYNNLFDSQQGVFKSNGISFSLVFAPEGAPKVLGVVRYIDANTDASTKNVARGDIFHAVNGQELSFVDDNNNNLDLFDADTYTLNFATIVNNVTTPNNVDIEFTKGEVTINPILIANTLDINGTKIGYLLYNRFTSNFDDELNNAFGQFKADGVTDLVLDMRYNPGGSVQSAVRLASMITGQFNGQLFIKQRWNEKIQPQLSDAQLIDNFTSEIDNGVAINSLNLSKVYVIATDGSASASELVINGLNAYIDVQHIGETTVGKNEFSITLVDDEENSYIFDANRTGNIAAGNIWGLQPLVGRNENADGFSDYTAGLAPDTLLEESLLNLGILGDVSEPLLAEAIFQITGVSSRKGDVITIPMQTVTDSNAFTLLKDNMYVDLTKKNIQLAPLEIGKEEK